MLDIRFVKANPAAVRRDLEKRGDKEKAPWVDELIGKHDEWKALKEKADKLRHSRNEISQEINRLKKQGKDISSKVREVKELPEKITAAEEKLLKIGERLNFILQRLPNTLHDSVPAGKDGTENKEIRKWGTIKKRLFGLKSHGELLEQSGLADFERATKISGAGFYFLKGGLVKLELGLAEFATDFLVKKGFMLIQPPLIMNRKPYEGVTSLTDFENVMYRVEDEKDKESGYLIATSEHPIAAMMMNETIEEKSLPLKFCGISSCFRREIGSHGVDTRGLFRVHQFTKVEQFVFCKPEDSWKIHEELLKNSEEIMQQLKIPYRIVNICTGDIGTVAAKKYDIEGWFPRQNAYRELVSCSNCTSYQSTSLNIRFHDSKGEKGFVHTLNATAVATSRVIAAIAENFQDKDGNIAVPEALVPYVGKTVIGK